MATVTRLRHGPATDFRAVLLKKLVRRMRLELQPTISAKRPEMRRRQVVFSAEPAPDSQPQPVDHRPRNFVRRLKLVSAFRSVKLMLTAQAKQRRRRLARPKAPVSQAPAPVRAELRDFRGLDHKPSGRGKSVFAVLLFVAAVVAVANGFYFGIPRQRPVATEASGAQTINVSGASALVTVNPDWLPARDANLPRLVQALRARQVKKAVVMLPNGTSVGIIDVASGKLVGASSPTAAK